MQPPLIVSACFDAATQALLDGLRTEYFPPERNHLAAHLTLFHALPGALEAEVSQALSMAVQVCAPAARLTGLMPLGRGFAARVQAPQLRDIHAALQQQFADSLTSQDRSPLRPHVTLQNKVESGQAKADRARAEQYFVPQDTNVVSLRLWQYLGGPWRPIRTFAFLPAPSLGQPTR